VPESRSPRLKIKSLLLGHLCPQYPSSLALLLRPPCWPILRFLVSQNPPAHPREPVADDVAGFRSSGGTKLVTLLDTDDDLQEMVSYRKNVTGVAHTVFISPKGNARHAPRVKIAIDPPDSLDPRSETASIGLDGHVVAGEVEPELLRQAQRFVALNRQALSEYWHYRIDTDELRQRLQSIEE
jgi:hypothetical protein